MDAGAGGDAMGGVDAADDGGETHFAAHDGGVRGVAAVVGYGGADEVEEGVERFAGGWG